MPPAPLKVALLSSPLGAVPVDHFGFSVHCPAPAVQDRTTGPGWRFWTPKQTRSRPSPTATAVSRSARYAPNQRLKIESVLRIVSSRSDPVEMMAAGTPLTSSSRRTYARAASGKSS